MYRRPWKRHSFYASLCPAIQQQKLLSSLDVALWKLVFSRRVLSSGGAPISQTPVPVSVKQTFLQKIIHIGILAFRSPNQKLESSFCRWIAGHGLAQKKCLFTDTGITRPFPTCPLNPPVTRPQRRANLWFHRCRMRPRCR